MVKDSRSRLGIEIPALCAHARRLSESRLLVFSVIINLGLTEDNTDLVALLPLFQVSMPLLSNQSSCYQKRSRISRTEGEEMDVSNTLSTL
jgi:hypothetical protein